MRHRRTILSPIGLGILREWVSGQGPQLTRPGSLRRSQALSQFRQAWREVPKCRQVLATLPRACAYLRTYVFPLMSRRFLVTPTSLSAKNRNSIVK